MKSAHESRFEKKINDAEIKKWKKERKVDIELLPLCSPQMYYKPKAKQPDTPTTVNPARKKLLKIIFLLLPFLMD